MTQADRVFSTPPTDAPADPTRRSFLSTAAGIAAGGSALALASLPANAADDPAFGLIEAHRAAHAALEGVAREEEYDDDAAAAANEAEQSALTNLIEGIPATVGGVIATMRYVRTMVDPLSGKIGDGEIGPLLSNLAEALQSIEAA